MTIDQPPNDNSQKMLKNILIIILFLISLGSLYKIYTEGIRTDGITSGLMMNDSIKIYRDKYNREVSKVQALNEDVLHLVYSRDSSLLALKKIVKDNKLTKAGNAAIIVKNETKLPNVVTKIDSSFYNVDSTDTFLYAEIDQFGDWIKGAIIASSDSIYLNNFTIRNSFSIILKTERTGFLKPKKTFALITNENPYTETKDFKVYQVQVPPAKKGLFFVYGIGVGIGVTTVLLILK